MFSRLIATLSTKRQDRRLAADIEDHLAALTEGFVRKGLSPEEAEWAARREFGAIEPMKETYRDQARYRLLENLGRDLNFAVRQCRRNPGFTALAIISLALGIGANTALFSFVNAILLKRLPVAAPEQLVAVKSGPLSYSRVNELNRDATQLDGLLGRFPIDVSVSLGDHPRWLAAELVTGSYFHTLGVKAARGRLLSQWDLDDAEGDPVCVVSYRFWRDTLASDSAAIGRTLRINMRQYRIVGVTQPGFTGSELQQPADLQIPATRLSDFMPAFVGMPNFDWKTRLSFFSVLGRLRPNGTTASAAAELTRLNHAHPEAAPIQLASGAGGFTGEAGLAKPATILLGVSAVVLLIACANLATLLLSRTSARSAEFAVRLAIGSSRKRVMGQLIVESALLAVVGAGIGIALAFGIDATILQFLNRTTPGIHQLHIAPDATVLLFATGISLLCVLLFATAPAWQAAGTAPLGSSAGNTGSGNALRRGFVAAQIALSFVVLFAAGLLTQTLNGLETLDLGYRPDQVAVIEIRPSTGGYSGTRATQFYSQLIDRLRALPGIQAASTAFGMNQRGWNPMKLDASPETGRPLDVNVNGVGPGYFDTIGSKLITGRDFSPQDRSSRQQVYIINQHLAKAYFHSLDPVGRYLLHDGRRLPVVGVVADVHDNGLRNSNSNAVYQDADQLLASSLSILARCQGDCEHLLPALRTAVQQADPNTPVLSIHTMRSEIDGALSTERILGFLSTMFAVLAVLLTAAGLYGVISYSVTRRRREIGLRLAIGASIQNIVGLLAKETIVLVGTGALVGIPLALTAVTFLKSQLYGVTEHDPATMIAAGLCIAFTAVAAALIPIRRAIRIAPQQALRIE